MGRDPLIGMYFGLGPEYQIMYLPRVGRAVQTADSPPILYLLTRFSGDTGEGFLVVACAAILPRGNERALLKTEANLQGR